MTSGTGTCTVHYNQAGGRQHNAAPEKTRVTAEKADQTITIAGNAERDLEQLPPSTPGATRMSSVQPRLLSDTGGAGDKCEHRAPARSTIDR